MAKKENSPNWQQDENLIAEAVAKREQETRRQLSVIAEVLRSEFGELLLGSVDRWIELFKDNHVKRDIEEHRLWRGAVIAMESFKQGLVEARELDTQYQQEEIRGDASMEDVYNDDGIYSDI